MSHLGDRDSRSSQNSDRGRQWGVPSDDGNSSSDDSVVEIPQWRPPRSPEEGQRRAGGNVLANVGRSIRPQRLLLPSQSSQHSLHPSLPGPSARLPPMLMCRPSQPCSPQSATQWTPQLTEVERERIRATFADEFCSVVTPAAVLLKFSRDATFRNQCLSLAGRAPSTVECGLSGAMVAVYHCFLPLGRRHFCRCDRRAIQIEDIREAFEDVGTAYLCDAVIAAKRRSNIRFGHTFEEIGRDLSGCSSVANPQEESVLAATMAFVRRQHARLFQARRMLDTWKGRHL